MREEIEILIKEMQDACRRSLFNGISSSSTSTSYGVANNVTETLSYAPTESSAGYPESETGSATSVPRGTSAKKSCIKESQQNRHRTWDEILGDASARLSFMTEQEHGQVTRIAGIMLLGFLLPQSTGNEFFLLQNLSSKRMSDDQNQHISSQQNQKQISGIQTAEYIPQKENMGDYIVNMSLEERLESCPHRYNPDEFGEFDSVVFEPVEIAFQKFLRTGLVPFLSGRPSHTEEVDLLHIIAMAIHPHPSEQSIPETTNILDESGSEFWELSKRLMTSMVSHSFHLNYRHRLQLTTIVADYLTLPEYDKVRARTDAPLFEGALPHLRASLYAFGMGAMKPLDAHVAQCAMVALTLQSGIEYEVKEEWSRLLHRLVDDRTNYPDCGCHRAGNESSSNQKKSTTMVNAVSTRFAAFSLISCSGKNQYFCPHRARGDLLRQFLRRHNQARHFADNNLLQYALASLTDAIEMQVDCWTKEEVGEENSRGDGLENDTDAKMKDSEKNETTNQPPCVLASLLSTAKDIFYFVLPITDNSKGRNAGEEDESEESHRKDVLVSCGIQLVHHWHPTIVLEACTMLVLAFSYTEEMFDDYVGAVFESLKIEIDILFRSDAKSLSAVVPVEGLVGSFSRRSVAFASNVMRLILDETSMSNENMLLRFRLVAAVAFACPTIAQKYRGELEQKLTKVKSLEVKKNIIASLLSCRRARFFANEQDSEQYLIRLISSASLSGWDNYQVARHALLTGNFGVAKILLHELSNAITSEKYYIWLSALEQVAEAEALFSTNGAKALPRSASNIRMAISTLSSLPDLQRVFGAEEISTDLQVRFLDLRVCFLDLMTSTRQLVREMRLTGVGPKKYSRSHLHLKNIVRSFDSTGKEYLKLYRQHGLFICQQSRSVIRTLQTLCDFVAKALRCVFVDSFDEKAAEKKELIFSASCNIPKGDSSQPLMLLMQQLEKLALKDMGNAIDAKIRATAMIEILDGVLKAPVPIPRALTTMKTIPWSSLQLALDPDEHDDDDTETRKLEVNAGDSLSFFASGNVSLDLLSKAQIPFNIILLRYKFIPKSGLCLQESNLDVEVGSEITKLGSSPMLCPAPSTTSLSSSGAFFVKVENMPLPEQGNYDLEFCIGCRDVRGGVFDLPLVHEPPRFPIKVV